MNDIIEGETQEIKREHLADYLYWLAGLYGTPALAMEIEQGKNEKFLKITFLKSYKCKPIPTFEETLTPAKWVNQKG
ncbi:hypothetical protein [Roseivirga sp. UBA838]|uniref:hypothetical protein n=1 Tax=Roseivirga sp. UBA838 TaxID=1947393 RepID=UPI00257D6F1C|nr:hypothetical protein [Roseivirga sp. UBA838]|tara:strand:- start:5395 stop:5625 length:231 start_codon:yes stop_codon:yes gene_type:complete